MKKLSIAVFALSLVIGALTVANAQGPIDDLTDPGWFNEVAPNW